MIDTIEDQVKASLQFITSPISSEAQNWLHAISPIDRPARDVKPRFINLTKAFGHITGQFGGDQKKIHSDLFVHTTSNKPAETIHELGIAFDSISDEYQLPKSSATQHLIELLTSNPNNDPSSREKMIYILGKRGSGKTFIQNKVINSSDELLQHNVTVFRADVSKLHVFHKYIENQYSNFSGWRNSTGPMTIAQYMSLHAFYVILKHGIKKDSKDSCLKRFDDHLSLIEKPYNPTHFDLSKTLFASSTRIARHRELMSLWHSIVNIFQDTFKKIYIPHNTDAKTRSAFSDAPALLAYLDSCTKIFTESNVGRIEELFGKAISFICSPHPGTTSSAGKVALFYDGIDNIELDDFCPEHIMGKSSSEWIQIYKGQLSHATNLANGVSQFVSHYVVSLRYDTYLAFNDSTHAALIPSIWQNGPNSPHVFHVLTVSPYALFDKKLRCVRSVVADNEMARFLDLNNALDSAKFRDETINIRIRYFLSFLRSYFDVHISMLDEFLGGSHDMDDVLRIVFNGNIRSYSKSVLNCFYRTLEMMQVDSSNKQFNHYHRLNWLQGTRAKQWIAQFSVSGCQDYFLPNENDEGKGRWCPNVFEPVQEGKGLFNRWHGLILLRLLEFFPLRVNDGTFMSFVPSTEDAIEYLKQFGYTEHEVRHNLSLAMDFGLIYRSPSFTNEPRFFKSKKGEFLREFSLKFSEKWSISSKHIYFCATGAEFRPPLHWPNDISAMRRALWAHEPYAKAISRHDQTNHATSDIEGHHFWLSCYRSGLSLLRQIYFAIEWENSNFEKFSTRRSGPRLPDVRSLNHDHLRRICKEFTKNLYTVGRFDLLSPQFPPVQA